MATKQAPFETSKVVKSAGKAGGITVLSVGPTLIAFVNVARAMGIQLWEPEQDNEIIGSITILSGAIATLWGTIKNLASNWNRPRKKDPTAMPLPLWLLIPIAAIALQGCVTTVPAFGGKTRAETSFEDGVSPEGVQYTKYTRNVELPAGVELNGQDDMSYGWEADGSGNIAIGQSGGASTMGQGELLGQRVQAETAMATALVGVVQLFGQLAAPLIGQNLDLDAAQKQQDTANDFALRQQFGSMMDQKLDQLLPIIQEQQGQMQQLQQQIVQQGGLIDRLVESLGGLPTPAPSTP